MKCSHLWKEVELLVWWGLESPPSHHFPCGFQWISKTDKGDSMGIKINYQMYLAFSGIGYIRAVVKLTKTCFILSPNLDFGAYFGEGLICRALLSKHLHGASWTITPPLNASEWLLNPSHPSNMSFSFTQNKTCKRYRENQDISLSILSSFQG